MMMKVLEAGGLPLLTDGVREADPDNPKGYYEFERVKKLPKGDTAWVRDARGRAVKVISALLKDLPSQYTYKVLFMNRLMPEILASQRKMLIRRGKADSDRVPDERMGELLEKHVLEVKHWLSLQPNFQVLDVDYNAMVKDPRPHVRRINEFLGGILDEEAMVREVDPTLYRNRSQRS